MNQFEKHIGETFAAYRQAKIANLFFLHPPMRIAGMHGSVPCYVQAGKAPYDLGGFFYDANATAIGVELKETAKRETSLTLVAPEKKGSGLQYHQLEALVGLHRAGGIALLVWSNAGQVGVLGGAELEGIKIAYDASLKAEKMSKTVAKGARSIRWEMFKPAKYGPDTKPLWLPRAPPPCTRKSA
jgi:hypothetical protein